MDSCIEIGVSFQPPTQVQGGAAGITKVKALIDTGSQWNLIDEDLIKAHNPPVLERLMNHGVARSAIMTNHRVWFMLYSGVGNMLHETGAGGINLSGRMSPWRVILGRKFLQGARFTYDSTAGIGELEILVSPQGFV
ncbi:hypothetical protein WN72_09470 [Bradyrhizobium arachidis]|uniref:Aspartyl protease n=2 Tax=Bradyrhizobium arachidis TaxID=858423 RepID=A0AAE7TFA3_9BRAD|nr:hypothetical protein WN72_09470 [Bradyrhizobium arachidis]